MPQALIIAGVTAAASIGGSVLSASAQKKAANKAAQASTDNTATNNALIRETYQQNATRLDPYNQQGMAAGNVLSEMLLGNRAPSQQAPTQAPPQSAGQSTGQYGPPIPLAGSNGVLTNPTSARDYAFGDSSGQGGGMFGALARANALRVERDAGGWMTNAQISALPPAQRDAYYASHGPAAPTTTSAYPATPAAGTIQAGTPAAGSPNPGMSAWDTFRNSTNYQWRLNEGNKGLNQQFAANGMIQSGAAMKGIADYNQNFASNELGNWQNMLAQQQGFGLTAASALAGVATSATNGVVAQNTNASNATIGALGAGAAANTNMYNSIGGAIGQVAGSIGRTSYAPAAPTYSGGSALGGPASVNTGYTPINYSPTW